MYLYDNNDSKIDPEVKKKFMDYHIECPICRTRFLQFNRCIVREDSRIKKPAYKAIYTCPNCGFASIGDPFEN